jgi:hypothetical protein
MSNLPTEKNPSNRDVGGRTVASAEMRDLHLINAAADLLNLEAAEVLDYQSCNSTSGPNR